MYLPSSMIEKQSNSGFNIKIIELVLQPCKRENHWLALVTLMRCAIFNSWILMILFLIISSLKCKH